MIEAGNFDYYLFSFFLSFFIFSFIDLFLLRESSLYFDYSAVVIIRRHGDDNLISPQSRLDMTRYNWRKLFLPPPGRLDSVEFLLIVVATYFSRSDSSFYFLKGKMFDVMHRPLFERRHREQLDDDEFRSTIDFRFPPEKSSTTPQLPRPRRDLADDEDDDSVNSNLFRFFFFFFVSGECQKRRFSVYSSSYTKQETKRKTHWRKKKGGGASTRSQELKQ